MQEGLEGEVTSMEEAFIIPVSKGYGATSSR